MGSKGDPLQAQLRPRGGQVEVHQRDAAGQQVQGASKHHPRQQDQPRAFVTLNPVTILNVCALQKLSANINAFYHNVKLLNKPVCNHYVDLFKISWLLSQSVSSCWDY